MWSGIATTKPVSGSNNPLSEVLKADSKLQATHFGLPQQELQEEIHKQWTDHNAIIDVREVWHWTGGAGFNGAEVHQDLAAEADLSA